MRKSLIALAAMSALACGAANAAIDNFVAYLYGANETGGGDTNGFGLASVSIDRPTNTVSWAILAQDIDLPLTGAHIHSAPAGVNGPVIINFSGSLNGTVVDADAAGVTQATAGSFYVNLHNAAYPAGAIRGQLAYVGTANLVPEPQTYALLIGGLGAVGLVAWRRRRSA